MKYWLIAFCLVLAGQNNVWAQAFECTDNVTPRCLPLCSSSNAAKQRVNTLFYLPQIQRDQGKWMNASESLILTCAAYKLSQVTQSYLTCEKTWHPVPKAREAYGQLLVEEQKFLDSQDEPLIRQVIKTPEQMCSKAWQSPIPAKR